MIFFLVKTYLCGIVQIFHISRYVGYDVYNFFLGMDGPPGPGPQQHVQFRQPLPPGMQQARPQVPGQVGIHTTFFKKLLQISFFNVWSMYFQPMQLVLQQQQQQQQQPFIGQQHPQQQQQQGSPLLAQQLSGRYALLLLLPTLLQCT